MEKKTKPSRISMNMRPEMYERLEKESRETMRTKTAIVHLALEAYFSSQE